MLNREYLENQRRAARTVVLLITVYVLMNFPMLLSSYIGIAGGYPIVTVAKSVIFGVLFADLNAAVNPLVYYYRTPQLREHIKKLFCQVENRVESSVEVL